MLPDPLPELQQLLTILELETRVPRTLHLIRAECDVNLLSRFADVKPGQAVLLMCRDRAGLEAERRTVEVVGELECAVGHEHVHVSNAGDHVCGFSCGWLSCRGWRLD